MPEPALTITPLPVTSAVAQYPLATQTGIRLLQHRIIADRVWKRCTKVQRALLDVLCRPLLERLVTPGELTVEDMPSLPPTTRSSTRGSLSSAGLVDNHDRLTGQAVHAWYYAVAFKERSGGAA